MVQRRPMLPPDPCTHSLSRYGAPPTTTLGTAVGSAGEGVDPARPAGLLPRLSSTPSRLSLIPAAIQSHFKHQSFSRSSFREQEIRQLITATTVSSPSSFTSHPAHVPTLSPQRPRFAAQQPHQHPDLTTTRPEVHE
ncbi:hypothetical protein E2C01_095681 [Portunus trituberculatus]|uniref:Uncharacterized protein n=1 Tax=Portunus trituberculatus TaxID=210409 RepID=A0A5B7JZG3_PORTR|nr:hypothetical protein [Portunus trituberculatus]